MDGLTTAVADDRRPPHSSYLTFLSLLLFEDDQAYYRHIGGGRGMAQIDARVRRAFCHFALNGIVDAAIASILVRRGG